MYRIIDKTEDTIFCYFSKTRDHQAALACVRGAIRIAGFIPDKINSDGSTANKLAVKIINQEIFVSQQITNPGFYGPACNYLY